MASFLQMKKQKFLSFPPVPVIILPFGEICETVAKKLTLAPMVSSGENLKIGVYSIQEVSKSCRFTADLHRLENLFSVKQ